ncbi:MAG: hypothetical protein H0X45_00790 [Planctomycetes bacterium]|nr:hypothetical protein [Planctomycetota bacterium]
MRLRSATLFVLLACVLSGSLAAESGVLEQVFAVTRDVRISFDPSDSNFNYGQATRLRTRTLGQRSGEALVLDFDRAAIATFLDRHRAKPVTARLLIVCRDVLYAQVATVEVVILDTTAEWTEGGNDNVAATANEVNFFAARTGSQQWADARGGSVADFREVFYDKSRDAFTTMVNPHALQAGPNDKDQQMSVQLDRAFVDHFARSPTSQGLVLCTRSNAIVDFFSREQTDRGAQLVLSAVE